MLSYTARPARGDSVSRTLSLRTFDRLDFAANANIDVIFPVYSLPVVEFML